MSHHAPRRGVVKLTTAALGLLILALAAVTVWTSLDVSRSSSRASVDLKLGVIYQDIRAAVADEGAAGQAYRDDPVGARMRLREAQGRLREGVEELRRRGTRGDRAIAPYIVADELRYQWAARELFAAVDRSDPTVAERTFRTEMVPAYSDIQQLVDLAARVHRDRALEATSGVTRRSARFAGVVSLAYVAGFLLLGVCTWFLVRMQATLREMASRQHHLARHDSLTGLPNRRLWHELAETRLSADESFAVVIVDLDAFKHVNDTLGHDQGDAMLRIVAERLSGVLRTDDVVARMGGDEFAILLSETDEAGAVAVAVAVQAALDEPCRLRGLELRPHGSAGIALAPQHGTDVDTLLKHADRAMYGAKDVGGGWLVFTDAMRLETSPERKRIQELRTALERDELSLRYQPIVSVSSGEMVLVEALVRWEHPVDGTVEPDDFIPLAERSGLIVPLGRWVLRTACAQAQAWTTGAAQLDPVVSVNLSPRQLLDPNLIGDVQAALVDHGLAPDRLMLEITETSVMEDPEAATARLRELSAIGVGLAVDDFGTGHSALAYLRQLPLTDLKLARPFVQDLENSIGNVDLARGIIALAHTLGLRVIAEGIETPEQLERLRGMGCDLAQGYLFARPLPALELARLQRLASGWPGLASPADPVRPLPSFEAVALRGGR